MSRILVNGQHPIAVGPEGPVGKMNGGIGRNIGPIKLDSTVTQHKTKNSSFIQSSPIDTFHRR